MAERPPSLADLPGSGNGRGGKTLSNFDLMPTPGKLPGSSPPKSGNEAAPPVEQLGTGSKIPESYDSRMLSQFSIPDPAIYSRKKPDASVAARQDSWWTNEARPAMLSCAPYKNPGQGGAPDGKDTSPKAEQARAQQAAQEKAKVAKEQKALMDQKNFLLSSYCDGPNAQPGSPESCRVMGQVSEINRQLGLPSTHFGNWKIPT